MCIFERGSGGVLCPYQITPFDGIVSKFKENMNASQGDPVVLEESNHTCIGQQVS